MDVNHEIAGKLAELLCSKGGGNGSKSNWQSVTMEFLGAQYQAQSYSLSFKMIWMMGINGSSPSLQMTRNVEDTEIHPKEMSLYTETLTGWKTGPVQETH